MGAVLQVPPDGDLIPAVGLGGDDIQVTVNFSAPTPHTHQSSANTKTTMDSLSSERSDLRSEAAASTLQLQMLSLEARASKAEALLTATQAFVQECAMCHQPCRLVVNVPCGDSMLCSNCTLEFRKVYGAICGACRKPSTVVEKHSFTCNICKAEVSSSKDLFSLRPCLHWFCVKCMCQLVRVANSDTMAFFPFRCPSCAQSVRGSTTPTLPPQRVDVSNIHLLIRLTTNTIGVTPLREREVNKFVAHHNMSNITELDRLYCPKDSCGLPMYWEGAGKIRETPLPPQLATCTYCTHKFCASCRRTYHGTRACPKLTDDSGDSQQLILSTTKPCPNCGFRVTRYRDHHCHHIEPGMGCRQCGQNWCYACGKLNDPPTSSRCPSGCQLFCNEKCDCQLCPDCAPGKSCSLCSGCPVCRPSD
eukprot:Lithocolla_globosa_v1_NODE_1117_length_2856_cov_30.865405.p1 type:complete len:419 gc:universal NODE_1117_length_2856_cov_30.865405:1565-2821(+)